jgi:hypothetical protein
MAMQEDEQDILALRIRKLTAIHIRTHAHIVSCICAVVCVSCNVVYTDAECARTWPPPVNIVFLCVFTQTCLHTLKRTYSCTCT